MMASPREGAAPRSSQLRVASLAPEAGSRLFHPLQSHFKELPPFLAVRRDFADLGPAAFVADGDGVADFAKLGDAKAPLQFSVRDLGFGFRVVAPVGIRLKAVALRLLVIRGDGERVVDDVPCLL